MTKTCEKFLMPIQPMNMITINPIMVKIFECYVYLLLFSVYKEPADFDYYGTYLANPAIRKAIHVGNLTYNSGDAVEKHLLNDVMDTVKPWIGPLMDNYKVTSWTLSNLG